MNDSGEKSVVNNGITYNYSSDWIYKLENELHWMYYWKQQEQLSQILHPGESILEIGVGSGFTSNYLKAKGYRVTTIDIDEEKKPDIVANIVTHNFADKFDHVIAFEVFGSMTIVRNLGSLKYPNGALLGHSPRRSFCRLPLLTFSERLST